MQDQTGNALYSHGLYQSHNEVISLNLGSMCGFKFFFLSVLGLLVLVFGFLFGVGS